MNRSLSVNIVTWPLKTPFRITGRSYDSITPVVVEISEAGHIGRGEGMGVYYIGETPETILADIEKVRGAVEAGATRTDLLDLLPAGGARNAIDCALWDLDARIQGKSVSEMVGVELKPVMTVWTIGIESTSKAMAEKAMAAAEYPILKVKLDSEAPIERMRAIRAARPEALIVIDANQGLDASLLKEVIPVFQELDILMIEQPLMRGGDDVLERFASPIPLCADESCLNRAELGLVTNKYDMINIKLDKTGGLTEALHLAKMAKEAGKKVMVGNMLGTSLAMAPALVLAQFCDFVDIDGPLHLTDDYPGGLSYKKGLIEPASPGFWGSVA